MTPEDAALCERLKMSWPARGWVAAKKINAMLKDERDAAAAIERLSAENEALREALEPFAKAAELFDTGQYVNRDACIYRPAAGDEYTLDSGHLLDARTTLKGADQ